MPPSLLSPKIQVVEEHLRSPLRALFEVRIFSARCFGGYACGEVNRD
jgi:hypothetical protein